MVVFFAGTGLAVGGFEVLFDGPFDCAGDDGIVVNWRGVEPPARNPAGPIPDGGGVSGVVVFRPIALVAGPGAAGALEPPAASDGLPVSSVGYWNIAGLPAC